MKRTNALIIICVLISFLYWFLFPDYVREYLVYSGEGLLRGVLWTPVTALFVHFNLLHLLGNMVFLYVFGRAVEETAGSKMVLPFLVGGIGASIISSFYYGFDVSMIGASGAIFTLAAVAMLTRPLESSWLFLFAPLGLVAILLFVFNVSAVRLGLGGNVGYVAHVAGFLFGIPFGIALSKGKWLKNLGLTVLLLGAFVAIIFVIQFALLLFE